MKLVTLLFLQRQDQLLLAMKKRGFGRGKWNGAGGKAEPGETPEQAAIRECQEEIGVTPSRVRPAGRLLFYDTEDPSFGHDAHIFTCEQWQGEPVETDEMRPQWFALKDIPYHEMWADDIHWLPHLLAGKLFEGTVTLQGDKIVSHQIQVVTRLGQA